MRRAHLGVLVVLLFALHCIAQNVQVNKDNRTIYVSSEGSAEAVADVATIDLGYDNFGPNHEQVFAENVAAIDRVEKALQAAGVKSEQITTSNLVVERSEPDEKWTAEERRQKQFHAHQRLTIKVRADQAQDIVQMSMSSGANELSNVAWSVADPVKLQAAAGRNALEKARTLAEQMAQGLNTKLGPLVYASNTAPLRAGFPIVFSNLNTASATIETHKIVQTKIRLFPQKVSETTTVYAVFAIE